MGENPFERGREEIKTLLRDYHNFKTGKKFTFLEENSFEIIIEHFVDLDQYDSALEAANHAIEIFPYSSTIMVKKADLLIILKRFDEALSVLEKAAVLDNSDPNLDILKIEVYLAKEMEDVAIQVFEHALEEFSGSSRINFLLDAFDVFDDYANHDKSFECLKMILEDEPENEEALDRICFWAELNEREEEIIELHLKIIDQYPFNKNVWFNLGVAYQGLKLYEKAIDAYLYTLAIDDSLEYAHRNLADCYIRIRKYREAIDALLAVCNLTQHDAVIYEAIGYCYQKLKNYDQARLFLNCAFELDETNASIKFKIAQTYISELRWKTALEIMKQVVGIDRYSSEYYYALAQCHQNLGDYKSAIIEFAHVTKTKPRNMKAWKSLITCLYHQSYYEEMRIQIVNGARQNRNKPIFFYYLAVAQFALGNSKDALNRLQIGLSENPSLVKEMLALEPSLLKNYSVVELIRSSKAHGKK